MNKLIAIGMSVFGLGFGGWYGYQLGSAGSDAPLAKTDTSALTKLVPGLSPVRADVDSAALRALIREEMTAVLAGAGNGVSTALAPGRSGGSLPTAPQPGKSGGAPAASAPEAVSAEVQAQRREALEQASALVAQGTWGNEQRMSFREKLAMLDPQQRDQALQQFATAINNGTLTVTTDGPPL